ncbi:hypothetical protein NOVOSPHI9U_440012 [Novosphingobium sp. 9U]|nr:hypothetical protein NOVOSPHI9U_440012 [Novosphingobium sp. 9U]
MLHGCAGSSGLPSRAMHYAAPLLSLDFAIVAGSAHRLSVLAVPKELEVAAVGRAVVHDRGRYSPAFSLTADAQRVGVKEGDTGLLPLAPIAALR